MKNSQPLLELKFDAKNEASISVDEFVSSLKNFQLCIKRLGQVLSKGISMVKPGRIGKSIEDACNLDIIAIEKGSLRVGLDLPTNQEIQVEMFGKQESLGKVAVSKFVEGIELLGSKKPSLAVEFDYGVLVSLRDASRILTNGIDHIDIFYKGDAHPVRKTAITKRVREKVIENITAPIKSAVEVKGKLREVDLERNSCQIYPNPSHFIRCTFEQAHESLIKDCLDLYVRARGDATLREADGQIRELRIKDIEKFEAESAPLISAAGSKKLTARALLQSGLVGMWKDRKDIEDSSKFARELRERAQKRQGS